MTNNDKNFDFILSLLFLLVIVVMLSNCRGLNQSIDKVIIKTETVSPKETLLQLTATSTPAISQTATSTITVLPLPALTNTFIPTQTQTILSTSTAVTVASTSQVNLLSPDKWEHYVDHNAQAEVAQNSGKYCLSIAYPGNSGFEDVILHQKDVQLNKGAHYRVSFLILGDPIKQVDYRVMRLPDYQQKAGEKINLTTNYQVFMGDFMESGDGIYSVDLEFRVGGTAPGKVCISNMWLEEVNVPSQQASWVKGVPPTCKNPYVGMQNTSKIKVNSEQEMWDKDGHSVGASKSEVNPGDWGGVGWSGNPPPKYVGNVKWLIVFTDQTTGKVLAIYPGNTDIDCTKNQ